MFTQNYINWMKAAFTHTPWWGACRTETVTLPTGETGNIDFPDSAISGFGGAMRNIRVAANPTDAASSVANVGFGVYFGTGTTPPTKADYAMEAPITSGIKSAGLATPVLSVLDGGGYSVECVYEVENTSGSDISVSEIGVFIGIKNKLTSKGHAVLAWRDVLETPFNIPAGAVKSLSFKLNFNQPA